MSTVFQSYVTQGPKVNPEPNKTTAPVITEPHETSTIIIATHQLKMLDRFANFARLFDPSIKKAKIDITGADRPHEKEQGVVNSPKTFKLSGNQQPDDIPNHRLKKYEYANPCCFKNGKHDGTSIELEVDIDSASQYPEDTTTKIDRMLSRAIRLVNLPYPGKHHDDELGRDDHAGEHALRQGEFCGNMMDVMIAIDPDYELFFKNTTLS